MPFNEDFLNRIREILLEQNISFTEKKMFSGVCIMVDDKMCCGTHADKHTGEDVLMCRIGEQAYEKALDQPFCTTMEFTGKPMKGYVYVTAPGLKNKKQLTQWLNLCLAYNPIARRSKK